MDNDGKADTCYKLRVRVQVRGKKGPRATASSYANNIWCGHGWRRPLVVWQQASIGLECFWPPNTQPNGQSCCAQCSCAACSAAWDQPVLTKNDRTMDLGTIQTKNDQKTVIMDPF
mmetsp:Transcript_82371/g.137742  ORF Transcript_82371/g.137742 Transcript_82371/m.137742 type:complete len:116 (-) Transcript_82371:250-597(-)